MYGKFFREMPTPPTRAERWNTPDGDELTLHRLTGRPGAPRLVVLHGLEGGTHSPYTQGLLDQAARRGWHGELIVWRTCDRDRPVNNVRRAYHSGETTDTQFVIERLCAAHPDEPIVLVGISLGGNVLLKWMGEQGDALPPQVRAGAAISVPFDLLRASRYIDSGIRRVYAKFFLKTLVEKTRAKLARFPDLVDPAKLDAIDSLWTFDEYVTGPIHGFTGALDYYTQSSSIRFLHGIRRPALLLNAQDDPFLPRAVLDDVRSAAEGNAALTLDFPKRGGHIGFIAGRHPWSTDYWMERRVVDWLGAQAGAATTMAERTASVA
jgi:predicted alpha/beta-fold hydrolase